METADKFWHTPVWVSELLEFLPAEPVPAVEGPAGRMADDALLSAGNRAIRELESVRQVSARLFPRKLPLMTGVTYAGVCVEARQAGGDLYDFFDLGEGRLGFLIGDVSGKGVASAMLRAAIQGSLQTLFSLGVHDMERALTIVNRLLYESAPEAMYSTLFLGEYDGRSQQLRYVNCGHPAPLLYGENGCVRLEATSSVLGLFSEWQCVMGEAELRPGDTLLLYSDGVSEATNAAEEEFGDGRLEDLLFAYSEVPVSFLLRGCVRAVRNFAGDHPNDDMTLVALRTRRG